MRGARFKPAYREEFRGRIIVLVGEKYGQERLGPPAAVEHLRSESGKAVGAEALRGTGADARKLSPGWRGSRDMWDLKAVEHGHSSAASPADHAVFPERCVLPGSLLFEMIEPARNVEGTNPVLPCLWS